MKKKRKSALHSKFSFPFILKQLFKIFVSPSTASLGRTGHALTAETFFVMLNGTKMITSSTVRSQDRYPRSLHTGGALQSKCHKAIT